MQLPMRDVTLPAAVHGQANGRLPDALLVDTPGQAGGPVVRLVASAAEAWRALCATAHTAAHTLTATSTVDSYRPYAVQENTFRARYTTTVLSGRPSVVWQGQRWYQRPGTAAAAVPGTSNHGLGLAIDIANVNTSLDWLTANAGRFGWSWELASEPWHIHYWAGDATPAAVLAYQHGPAPRKDQPMRYTFDGSWKDRPVDLGDHVITTDRVGRYWMEPAGLDAEGLDPVWTVTRTDIRDATWDFARMFSELTGGCVFIGKFGVATWLTAVLGGTPGPVGELSDAQLDALADRIVTKLGALRFNPAEPAAGA